MRGGRYIARERGQAFVELCLIVPIVALLLAFAVDGGRFLMATSSAQAAADVAARALEGSPGMSAAQLKGVVDDACPELGGTESVSIQAMPGYAGSYTHHITKGNGDFSERAGSNVEQDRYSVHVEAPFTWFMPGLAEIGGTVTVAGNASAVVDRTYEVW